MDYSSPDNQDRRIDPIMTFWFLLTTSIGSYGLYLLMSENEVAARFYVYGKSLDVKKLRGRLWKLFLLPKRFFVHFYVAGLVGFTSGFAVVILYYVPNNKFHDALIGTLEYLITELSKFVRIRTVKSVDDVSVILFTLILMTLQTSRRLYETLVISVFSKDAKINLIHYAFGHLFYIGAAISTVAPVLLSQTNKGYTMAQVLGHMITFNRCVCFTLFIYASHHQHECNVILANLRKDKTGRVISGQHFVPSGGLFEYVSCPHFSCEVFIYLFIILSQSGRFTYWNTIFVLVLISQAINAITEHKWYKKKWPEYPKQRRAIFPKLL